MAAVEAYPNLEAAVFDLPAAIEFARRFVKGTKVELIAGDFFADPLPPSDLYALGRILHDWDVERIERLLKRIFEALPSGGGLLIAEKLLGPTHVSAHMQSLSMLICTEGRERSLEQYKALLEAAGFRDVQGVVTGAPLDAILARKA
jgi:acetylserotonin N-methyltransferase